jgi:hypothetical protein
MLSGTSQAAPMIAGVIALLKAAHPSEIKNYKDALVMLNEISKDHKVGNIGGGISVGVPEFANAAVQSIGEGVKCDLDEETLDKFEPYDWEWEGDAFVSRSFGVYDA